MTRQDYMNDSQRAGAFREYYGQFVTETIRKRVAAHIGIERIRNSKDEHLNDIPLELWDQIPIPAGINKLLQAQGDWLSPAGWVCITKEAARQLVESKPTTSIYEDCVAAGIPTDSHESDLYIPVNDQTRALLSKHGLKAQAFTSQIDGKPWYDVPFRFDPWWAKRAK